MTLFHLFFCLKFSSGLFFLNPHFQKNHLFFTNILSLYRKPIHSRRRNFFIHYKTHLGWMRAQCHLWSPIFTHGENKFIFPLPSFSKTLSFQYKPNINTPTFSITPFFSLFKFKKRKRIRKIQTSRKVEHIMEGL